MASEYEQELEHMIDPTVPELTALETLRHSAAHVMADAVKQLWPDAQLAFGPHTEDGFYYDIKMEHRLSPDDFEAIEAKKEKLEEAALDAVTGFVELLESTPERFAAFGIAC